MNRVKELLLKAENFISQQELKELATLIITEEALKQGEEIPSIETPTIIEYYKKNIQKGKKYNLKQKIEIITNYFKIQGEFNPVEEKIMFFYNNLETIFLNQKIKKKAPSLQLLYLIFHEYKHMIQENNSNQMPQIETQLLNLDYEFYINNHSKFLFEIDASIYGILKAEEILKKSNLLTDYTNNVIEILKNHFCQNYADYNLNEIIEHYDEVYLNGITQSLVELLNIEQFYNISKETQSMYIINRVLKEKNLEELELWQKKIVLETLEKETENLKIRKIYISQITEEIDWTNLENLKKQIEEKIEILKDLIEQEEKKNNKKY